MTLCCLADVRRVSALSCKKVVDDTTLLSWHVQALWSQQRGVSTGTSTLLDRVMGVGSLAAVLMEMLTHCWTVRPSGDGRRAGVAIRVFRREVRSSVWKMCC